MLPIELVTFVRMPQEDENHLRRESCVITLHCSEDDKIKYVPFPVKDESSSVESAEVKRKV